MSSETFKIEVVYESDRRYVFQIADIIKDEKLLNQIKLKMKKEIRKL